MNEPKNIYFLCIQNRCRSQIAAAFANYYGKDLVQVHSAGIFPSTIHPQTIEVMKEVNIDISNETAKEVDMKILRDSNVVVKLCEEVNERCPVIPFGISNVQWNIEDPLPSGTDECDMDKLRDVREEIRGHVRTLLEQLDVIPREN